MTLLVQTALLVAITAFSMGVSVLAWRPANRLARRFFVLCLVISVSFLSFFVRVVAGQPSFGQLELLAWAWLGPAGMEVVPLLMGQQPPGWRLLRATGWCIALCYSVVILFAGFGTDAPAFWLRILWFSPGILLLQTLVVILAWRGLSRLGGAIAPLTLRQGMILAGAVFTLSSTPLDHMPRLGTVFPSLGNLWFCAYLIVLGQSITRRKLLDLPALIVRFLVLAFLAVGLGGVFFLLASWAEKTPAIFLLHSFAICFAIVLLLDPLQAAVAHATQRILSSLGAILGIARIERLRKGLHDLEQQLTAIHDPVVWQGVLEEGIRRSLGSRQAGLLRRPAMDSSHGGLRTEIIRRRSAGESTVLATPVLESELALATGLREQERLDQVIGEMLRDRVDIVIPFFDSEPASELMGWIWVSGVRSGLHLTPLRGGPILAELQGFASRLGPALRAMLQIRSLAEQERLAALGELSAGLAHEIRNPLGAIRGAVDLLPAADGSGRWAGVIREEVSRLDGLVRQFLELSRRPEPAREPMDLAKWLEAASQRLGAPDGAVVLAREGGPTEDTPLVSGDPQALLQVLQNWVRNSLQSGATRIELGVERLGHSVRGREVGIYVQDDGPGISPELQQKIFMPFFTTRREGTGLGLSICRQIARNHGGRIELSSRPGEGARFTLWLPARDAGQGGQGA